ncbi:hypothetical protein DO97_01970 [Neosynechococcus sphagnicola sy1]|uniref:RDD domain-containing protein n=1 Tax=Neosynechococcus sphagnicola sy1 TaxID=1497020 RepID=A0A098TLE2_9CYAN|nr:RDD family protein [Neosynechococcus sphagnicola]KGF73124.1 hypothetical protein DO97_01970 [Neosynechococcus sphagnicola sy1]
MHLLNHITLQTPESVELELVLAGIGNRALALGLDYTILAIALTVFLLLWGFLVSQFVDLLSSQNLDSGELGLWALAIALLILFTVYVGYFVIFETLWQGQTPGKRVARLRVIRDDGRPMRLPQATLRALLRPMDDLLFLGAFLIIFGHREKRLGDWVAGTLVIQEAAPLNPKDFVLTAAAPPLARQLQEIAQVNQLQPEDFAQVRNYLQRRQSLAKKPREQISLQLARHIKTLIALEQVPPGVTADLFLEAIYLAYQQSTPR